MLINIFNDFYEIFNIIINHNFLIDLFSLNQVCKNINIKMEPLIMQTISDKLILVDKEILCVHKIYNINYYVDPIIKNEIQFLSKLIFTYYKDFLTICKY